VQLFSWFAEDLQSIGVLSVRFRAALPAAAALTRTAAWASVSAGGALTVQLEADLVTLASTQYEHR
jgi:hypothetical protein